MKVWNTKSLCMSHAEIDIWDYSNLPIFRSLNFRLKIFSVN